MTRYEVEEIENHIAGLQEQLEDWAIDAREMELELAELKRMIAWLEKAMGENYPDGQLKQLLPQLEEKVLTCTECIQKRLSVRY